MEKEKIAELDAELYKLRAQVRLARKLVEVVRNDTQMRRKLLNELYKLAIRQVRWDARFLRILDEALREERRRTRGKPADFRENLQHVKRMNVDAVQLQEDVAQCFAPLSVQDPRLFEYS